MTNTPQAWFLWSSPPSYAGSKHPSQEANEVYRELCKSAASLKTVNSSENPVKEHAGA